MTELKTPPSRYDGLAFDKAAIAKARMSTSVLIAENVNAVGIKPQLTENGLVEYKVFIEYKPDSRYSKASLEGKITLVGVVDSTEYAVEGNHGVWSASYEERWSGEYTVETVDDATDENNHVDFKAVFYTNPMTAIHNLMAQDVASFFDMGRDDLGNIPDVKLT